MQYRKFGNTDLLASEIGFGAWAIGGGAMIGETSIGWGDVDDNVSMKAIHSALDAGINFFDTADIYGLGHSEEILGKSVGKRKDIIIATKGGNVARNNQFTTDYSKDHLINACENSLKRLKRDVIDYYQLHTARVKHLEDGECIQAMQILRQQGKIRYWGISLNTFDPIPEAEYFLNEPSPTAAKGPVGGGSFTHKVTGAAAGSATCSGFQLVLNLINQRALPILKTAFKKGNGIIARMPLQFGLLTGKFDKAVDFADNDHRKKRLTMEVINKSNEALQAVWELCKKYGCGKTELSLSYLLSYPEVSTIIAGIRTPEHVKSNTSGLFRLDAEDKEFIEELGRASLRSLMDFIEKQG